MFFLGATSIDGNQSPPTTQCLMVVNQMSIQHLMTYLLKILQVYILIMKLIGDLSYLYKKLADRKYIQSNIQFNVANFWFVK